MEWIKVEDRMPPEYDSMCNKFYGTANWREWMYRKCSGKVLVTYEDKKGGKCSDTGRTIDGKWHMTQGLSTSVIAWMPFPEPYGGEKNDNENS